MLDLYDNVCCRLFFPTFVMILRNMSDDLFITELYLKLVGMLPSCSLRMRPKLFIKVLNEKRLLLIDCLHTYYFFILMYSSTEDTAKVEKIVAMSSLHYFFTIQGVLKNVISWFWHQYWQKYWISMRNQYISRILIISAFHIIFCYLKFEAFSIISNHTTKNTAITHSHLLGKLLSTWDPG